jgi:hypothetical protein
MPRYRLPRHHWINRTGNTGTIEMLCQNNLSVFLLIPQQSNLLDAHCLCHNGLHSVVLLMKSWPTTHTFPVESRDADLYCFFVLFGFKNIVSQDMTPAATLPHYTTHMDHTSKTRTNRFCSKRQLPFDQVKRVTFHNDNEPILWLPYTSVYKHHQMSVSRLFGYFRRIL